MALEFSNSTAINMETFPTLYDPNFTYHYDKVSCMKVRLGVLVRGRQAASVVQVRGVGRRANVPLNNLAHTTGLPVLHTNTPTHIHRAPTLHTLSFAT